MISIILHSHLKTLKIPAVNIFVDQLKNVTFSKITGLYGSYDNKENSFFKQWKPTYITKEELPYGKECDFIGGLFI